MRITSRAGSIRPSQLVSTFGPGSIYDSQDDSFLIMGADRWKEENCKKLANETLLSHLKASGTRYSRLERFMVPISSKDDDEQVAIRTFPTWGVCPACGMLQRRNRGAARRCGSRTCGESGTRPTTNPARFIAACINGHLDDFPWYRWVHHGAVDDCSQNDARLYLEDGANSSSLESKTVRCDNCGRHESMAMSLAKNGLRSVLHERCSGRRPWLTDDDREPCLDGDGEHVYMQGIYKGATNAYFPKTMSAITIPPFAGLDAERIADKVNGTALLEQPREKLPDLIRVMFPNDEQSKVLKMIDVLREYRKGPPDIRTEEFRELNSTTYPQAGISEENFKTEPIELPDGFSKYLENLVLVRKLKVVATITGFYRLEPSGFTPNDSRRMSPVTNYPAELPRWLPAVENRGEGIFFSFKNGIITNWAGRTGVVGRFNSIMRRSHGTLSLNNVETSPKYVLLHTLSHLMIKEIATYAGYSVASMGERIYSGDSMSGVLIYTSSPSSDGSLGGLVEQGKKPKFSIMLRRAIEKSRLCSMDPMCSHAVIGTGSRSNGSACHACLYLPETSCESMNSLLDRALVHSTLQSGRVGLFA